MNAMTIRPARSSECFNDFEVARCIMLVKWLCWTKNEPNAAAVSAEIQGTIGALWGIAATVGAATPVESL